MNEAIYQLIDKFDVISFDFYGTLFYRAISDSDNVFKLVEKEFNILDQKKIYRFKTQRVRAEREARRKNKGKEVTLNEIYEYLSFDNQIKDKIYNIEINIEKRIIIPNLEMHRLFKKCILEKKKVIIVSDMYLPMRFFKGCLEKYFREDEYTIYVSSSIGYTKRSGDLWKYILNDLSISSEKILHVGDDYNIDILPAISEGICAYWYRCVDKNLKLYWNKTNIYEDWISGYIEKSGYLNGSGAYRVGYGLIGPVLYYYCFWAHEIVKKTKCTKIIFFAREGYLIKQVYECLFQDNSVELIYLRINKNTLQDDRKMLFYLKQNNIDVLHEKIVVINNSMEANGQRLLEEFISRNKLTMEVHWLYFILAKKGKEKLRKIKIDEEKYSVWFSTECKELKKRIFYINSLVFEELLFEAKGTAKKLNEMEQGIEVAIDDSDKSIDYNVLNRTLIQTGTKDFIRNTGIYGDLPPLNKESVLSAIYRFEEFPYLDDALEIGNIWYKENNICDMLVSPLSSKGMKKFFYGLKKSYWKSGYLIRSGYNLPILMWHLWNIYKSLRRKWV